MLDKNLTTFPSSDPCVSPNPAPLPDMYNPNHCERPAPPTGMKPTFTAQEEFIETTRRVNHVLHRVLALEENMRRTLDNLSSNLTADNVAFKNLCITTYNQFSTAVHAEVNAFETEMLNSYKLFEETVKNDWSNFTTNYDSFHNKVDEKINEFNENINNTYNTFRDSIEKRIENYNTTHETAFNDYVSETNQRLTAFENSLETAYNKFTNDVNNSVNSFKNVWAENVNERLDGQDSKINDVSHYFYTNFRNTVLSVVQEMKVNGEIAEIINDEILSEKVDTEVFNSTVNIMNETLATKEEVEIERQRINTLSALPEGSTTADAELMDIRVGADGESYESAGEAVRQQFSKMNESVNNVNSENLFSVIKPIKYVVYRGSNTPVEYDVTNNSDNIVNLSCYNETPLSTVETAFGFGVKLKKKIPYTNELNKKYTLFIKSDKDISNKIYCVLSSYSNWGAGVSKLSFKSFMINKGFNTITLESSSSNYVDGKDFFEYLLFPTNALETNNLEIYMCESDMISGLISQSAENAQSIFEIPNYRNFSSLKTKVTATETINRTNFKATIAEKTSDVAEWRYYVGSYPIGTYEELKGKSVIVRNNKGASYFGISINKAQWCKKSFKCSDGVSRVINFEEFINSNDTLATHNGEYYITFGVDFKTVSYNPAYEIDVDILFVKNFSETLNPLANFISFNPDEYVKKSETYIVCWGDSLTAQGGWTSELESLSGITVYNAGTGGESVKTIVARQGADVMTVNNIVIPSTCTPVLIADRSTDKGISTEFNKLATPLLQGGSTHINPVKLGDTLGTLNWTGESYADTNGTWTFTRLTEGEEITIDRPTAITTAYDREKNNAKLMIIFMGQNGGYESNEELVALHRRMIEHSKCENFLILGLATGSEETRKDYEETMSNAFGRYFVSLRKYLVEYGLSECGLTATESDNENKLNGVVSSQLFTDGVHFTEACRKAIGKYIYKKCCELNIL